MNTSFIISQTEDAEICEAGKFCHDIFYESCTKGDITEYNIKYYLFINQSKN